MSPLFLFTILIPEIIVHDVSFTFIRMVQRSSIVFFIGDEPQRYPIKQGSQKVRDFLGRGRSAASQTRQASFILQATSDERSSYDVKDSA